ncbi:TPA: hypothetical protein ACU9T0_006114 [Burkholderia cenocepacia]|uniref:hypothetical protein n=1 Tax=Burkholderia cenocepacia TaxID=95486 RepID=UPI002AB6ADDB|nr:hypothetical protein [Burkholderia cenocepacia]
MTTQMTVTCDLLTREAETMILETMRAAGEVMSAPIRAMHESSALGIYLLWSRVAGEARFPSLPTRPPSMSTTPIATGWKGGSPAASRCRSTREQPSLILDLNRA